MKSLMKFAVLGFLLIFAGWCFAQTAPKTQAPAPKAGTPEPAKSEDEDVIPPAEPNAIFPAVVARVNGKPVLGKDLEAFVLRELAPIGNPKWTDLREDYRSQLTIAGLETLLRTKLLYQKAVASGTKATSAEVQTELQRISKSFKDDAEMNTALANQLSDRASLEKDLYQSLTVARYVDENVNKKITVAPEEVTKYYTGHPGEFQHPDVVRTSHILIPAGETLEQDAIAKKKAEGILARIKKGEDFAKLAKEYSTDGSASQGGDVGFNAKDALAPEYGDAAFTLPIGGVKLIKSEFGYHIVKVADKKKEGLYTLEDVKDQLTTFLKNQKIQAELAKLVNQLRDEAKVEILIPIPQAQN